MRKTYTTILAFVVSAFAFGQQGQINNGGFENWSMNTVYDAPDDWISQPTEDWRGVSAILQSSDASDGLASLEITSKEIDSGQDTIFGYVLHGGFGENGPDEGIPYTEVFDEITFDYKSDLPVGDTLYLLAIRFDALGDPIEQIFEPAAFGTNSTWTNGSIAVTNTPQTELLIGFVLGDPFAELALPTPDVWARVDNVVLKNGATPTTNIPNYSFENWTTVSTEEPDNWNTINEILISANAENVSKTTDANSGSFAASLTTVYNAQWDENVGGYLNLGEIDTELGNPFLAVPYTASPDNFDYAYKYTGANGDLSGGISIEFYSGGTSIGGGFLPFVDQATYVTGSLPLIYAGTPDSVLVMAFCGDSLGSVAILDDLGFSGGDVGIEEFKNFSTDIYPNPASDMVMVKADDVYSIEIVDITGKSVFNSNKNSGVTTIGTDVYPRGVYFVKLRNAGKIKTHKLILN